MGLFRSVSLPSNAIGQLLLHSMPGREEKIDECWTAVKKLPVHSIVCLASDEEISQKSPSYFAAIDTGTVPCKRSQLAVPDFGVPEDESEFLNLASSVGESLKQGENVLVHCGAGIGRTGTFAALVLMRLGIPLKKALSHVHDAGSEPENQTQKEFLQRMANTDE